MTLKLTRSDFVLSSPTRGYRPTNNTSPALDGPRLPANKDKKDASEEYAVMLTKAENNLKVLEKLIKSHATQQARAPLNWGFVGDMTAINAALENIIQG